MRAQTSWFQTVWVYARTHVQVYASICLYMHKRIYSSAYVADRPLSFPISQPGHSLAPLLPGKGFPSITSLAPGVLFSNLLIRFEALRKCMPGLLIVFTFVTKLEMAMERRPSSGFGLN